MEAFTILKSRIIPLPRDHIDTDQIIPAHYLKVIDKQGLAAGLFSSWRYHPDGSPNPDFVLNQAAYQGARILLAGDNFGCGSSREHAPWALVGWGIRAIISTSFADIFRSNAMKNGLLPVEIEPEAHQQLLDLVLQHPETQVTIDLSTQSVETADGWSAGFPIDSFNKTCLLEGVDQLGYLLRHLKEIDAYEQRRPW